MFASRTAIGLFLAACTALASAGCGEDGQKVDTRGATLFAERCAGCHSLDAAGTEGSNPEERVAGPNLDNRRETKDQVLYAIRNGGFSGAIMPQNIVVGKDAEEVAEFVAKYAGKSATGPPGLTPGGGANEARGTTGQSGGTGSSSKSKSGSGN
jgi:mono/diheme cytochrome c family protein